MAKKIPEVPITAIVTIVVIGIIVGASYWSLSSLYAKKYEKLSEEISDVKTTVEEIREKVGVPPPPEFVCPECGEVFKTKEALEAHMASAHPPIKRTLTVTYAWPTYIDPAVGSDYSSSSSFVNLYDALVYPNITGEMLPHLATSWEISEDGLTWTFHLREGVKFHDGTELTAEDVVFSMMRLVTIGEGYSYLFSPYVDTVNSTAIDTYTVQFRLKKVFGPFISALCRLSILNKELVMENIKTPGPYGEYGDFAKDWLLTNDAGSGPYKVKEMRVEEELIMERFEDYWGEVRPDAPDEVHFKGVTEPATIYAMFYEKTLDITDQWQTEEGWTALNALPGVNLSRFIAGTPFYFMMHTKKAPTDDIYFRRALAWAFDYDKVVTEIFPGAKRTRGPVSSILPGWNPEVLQFNQNYTKARENLTKSPYYEELDKYPVEVHWCAEVPPEEKVALLFAHNMEEIGVTVKIVKTPWLSLVEEMSDIETSPHIATVYVSPHYPEAGSLLESRYHSKSAQTWEQNEWLQNETIDALIEDALGTLDWDARMEKYKTIQEKIVELCPSIFVYDALETHAYQPWIDWPTAKGKVNPVMGYNFECSKIGINLEIKKKYVG